MKVRYYLTEDGSAGMHGTSDDPAALLESVRKVYPTMRVATREEYRKAEREWSKDDPANARNADRA